MNAADKQFSIVYQRCAWNESLVSDIQSARDKGESFNREKLKQIGQNLTEALAANRKLKKLLKK